MKILHITAISSMILISCQSNTTTTKENTSSNIVTLNQDEYKSLNISTDTLKIKNISTTLHFKGKIDVPPQNIYSMSVPLGGYLKYTHLLPGMHIKKNEVIAVLEDPQYIQLQEDYLTNKNLCVTLEKNYIRQKELFDQNAVSEKVYEQAKSEYENCKVKLKSLEEKLQLINIDFKNLTPDNISRTINMTAPFTGYVTSVHFSTGKYIPPSEVLFELVNPEDIHLNIKIFEKDLPYIQIGQKVSAYTLQQPEKKYDCEIILINKMVNPDGTIDVHCHFDKYDDKLIPGTYMQADVSIENKSIYVIPASAVLFYDNHYYVFIQKDTLNYELKEIPNTTFKNDEYFAIENYQNFKGKRIVTKNAYALLMKLKNVGEEE
jgi:cobalt-zinc-cadmium efflux system membrane fusion protein